MSAIFEAIRYIETCVPRNETCVILYGQVVKRNEITIVGVTYLPRVKEKQWSASLRVDDIFHDSIE